MAIVGGLDIHRRQITYDYLDTDSGETRRGQLSPATRLELRAVAGSAVWRLLGLIERPRFGSSW